MKFSVLVAAALMISLLTGCGLTVMPHTRGGVLPPTTESWELITEKDAKGIALDHARLSDDMVTGLQVAFDIDDDRPEYEVQFFYNGTEYEYEIHGESGRIISYDRDK